MEAIGRSTGRDPRLATVQETGTGRGATIVPVSASAKIQERGRVQEIATGGAIARALQTDTGIAIANTTATATTNVPETVATIAL